MAMEQPTEIRRGCTTTRVEGWVEVVPLPTEENKRYLVEKADYGVRFPRLTLRLSASGELKPVEMRQLVMSGLIRLDEYRHDYRFDYKAEVSFDMLSEPPRPFLSSSGGQQDPDRRHTLSPFPQGLTAGLLRRPDVIIVKDPNVRWPGRAGPDHEGVMHRDNLERVVEVKFPGDELKALQRFSYERIAGGAQRFSVLQVIDCRNGDGQEAERAYNEIHQPTREREPKKWPSLVPRQQGYSTPVPVYGPVATLRAAILQTWAQLGEGAGALYDEFSQEIIEISEDLKSFLQRSAAWLGREGNWVRRESEKAWEWVSGRAGELLRWTDRQLQDIWLDVQRHLDLTLEMLAKIEWAQLLVDAGTQVVTVVVVIIVGGVMYTAGIPATVAVGLLLLIRLAVSFWRALAVALGTGMSVQAVAAQGD